MSQHTHHLSDDTSDRLYTPEELESYAAAEGRPDAPPATTRPDPLSDPLHEVEHTVIRPRPALPDPPPPPVNPLRQVTPVAGPLPARLPVRPRGRRAVRPLAARPRRREAPPSRRRPSLRPSRAAS